MKNFLKTWGIQIRVLHEKGYINSTQKNRLYKGFSNAEGNKYSKITESDLDGLKIAVRSYLNDLEQAFNKINK